ncbi:imidazolonepropionase [candidate division WOR-3 bacterium]|nr:imidazolonepropionase [candidate division WOR-3 bacterium]
MKKLFKDIKSVVSMNEGSIPKRGNDLCKIGLMNGVDILTEDGFIKEISPKGRYSSSDVDVLYSAEGLTALPGLIDAHTHAVFFGTRVNEFYQRSQGRSYLEILESGGGILSTVRSVRSAESSDIENFASRFIESFLDYGTTTVEIKSGYGLTIDDEIKMLRVIRDISERKNIGIVPTFLGAHAIPVEYEADKSKYVDLVCEKMIPRVAEKGLAVFCDLFCEKGVFSPSDSRRIAQSAVKNGLRMKFHAEQFSRSGVADLAVEYKAASVDHCVEMNRDDLDKISKTDTVMIFLPGTELILGQNKYAPARSAVSKNCVIALASDFNPGSCPIQSLWLIGSLGVIELALSCEEVLNAITVNAAYSLGIHNSVGLIKEGYKADMIFIQENDLREIFYFVGKNPVKTVVKDGKVIRVSE